MEDFLSLKLEQTLMDSIAKLNYKTPTPIQAQAIPVALAGKDILGTAQTGTGKTLAFGIPIINFLLKTKKEAALIITPTRELAQQVFQEVNNLVGRGNIRTAQLVGGQSMVKQLNSLKRNPRLIVGTPGRINDHLKRNSLKLNNTSFVALDEADRMLDQGFAPQINQILKTIPKKRQTLLFSATLPREVLKLSENYLTNPERISVGSTTTPIAKIKQEVLRVKDGDKYNQLIKEIYTRKGAILVFVKTRRNAEKMVKRLKYDDHDCDALHGNLRQNKRDRVIKAFRNNHFRILIATDVAARGLSVSSIKHVINFDLPQVAEDFIHRIGRTARAGAEGSALSFVGSEDRSKWNAIQRLIDPNFRAEPGSEARGRRKRGGRSFDRRGSRGGSRFKRRDDRNDRGGRDERPGSRFKRRDDRNDRGGRDERPGSRFKRRDDRNDRGGRDERPGSRFKRRDDRNDRGGRDERPGSRFKRRDDRNDRGGRDERPGSRFKRRDDRNDRGGRDERPGSRFKKRSDRDRRNNNQNEGEEGKSFGFKKKFDGKKKPFKKNFGGKKKRFSGRKKFRD